jgi:DNA (cytosine-5)-methyltransferase 1
MRVLDLFSGIGGFSLGLERAGMRTVAFCEIESYPRAVLAERWPGVPIYGDVRELTAAKLAADGIAAELICGGFPCQDISVAGKGVGITGERSGLWRNYARLISEIRPRYVIVENVSALLGRGLGDVLGDLAALGFDAEWHCIPAAALGAPHRRDRIWIVAYPKPAERRPLGSEQCDVERQSGVPAEWQESASRSGVRGAEMAYPDEPRLALRELLYRVPGETELGDQGQDAAVEGWWGAEPDVGRVAHGVPARVDRLTGLGNAVVPQIPEIIGRAIMRAEGLDRG